MKLQPFIIGRGNAGLAMAKSIGVIRALEPEFAIAEPIFLPRECNVANLAGEAKNGILLIANPHGHHADWILGGEHAGFSHIVAEKPACVSLSQSKQLRLVKAKVAMCHVYRQTWGPQTLRKMVAAGDFGDLVTVEGRYWQSSAAKRIPKANDWKNDEGLNGPHDVLLDLATHWLDLAFYIVGEPAKQTTSRRFFANAEAPHRDTHVLLNAEFDRGVVATASISKTFHGAGNYLELNVLGTRQSAQWTFDRPDEITVGVGSHKNVVSRETKEWGSRQSPFHGAGWIEGYIEIIRQTIYDKLGRSTQAGPKLSEHLDVVESLLRSIG